MSIDPVTIGLVMLAIFLLLIAAGVRIGFAALFIGTVGIWIFAGSGPAFRTIGTAAFGITANYAYGVIPLFILMGFFASYAGFADEIFVTARKWVGHLPGGLLVATIIGGTGFAAVCGSSVASAGVLTKVALPELEKYGYESKLSVGCIACTGTLAILIPPSLTMVIYSIMVEQSVSKMLIGGILPGLLTAVILSTYIVIRAWLKPSTYLQK